jgi:hypothetical protein
MNYEHMTKQRLIAALREKDGDEPDNPERGAVYWHEKGQRFVIAGYRDGCRDGEWMCFDKTGLVYIGEKQMRDDLRLFVHADGTLAEQPDRPEPTEGLTVDWSQIPEWMGDYVTMDDKKAVEIWKTKPKYRKIETIAGYWINDRPVCRLYFWTCPPVTPHGTDPSTWIAVRPGVEG